MVKNDKSSDAQRTSASLATITILSNIVVPREAPAAPQLPNTSGGNGESSDVDVLQVPYRGHQENVSDITPTMLNMPVLDLTDVDFVVDSDIPSGLIQFVEEMERAGAANIEMAASVSGAQTNKASESETAIPNLQNGVISLESAPEMRTILAPCPVAPLSDDDDDDFVTAPPKKIKLSSSHSKKQEVSQTAAAKHKKISLPAKGDPVVVAGSSSSKAKESSKNTSGSKLKTLLTAPHIISHRKSNKIAGPRAKTGSGENVVKCSVGGTATPSSHNVATLQQPACSGAVLSDQQRGLGIVQKRIEDTIRSESDSDSESDFVFSQDHYKHALKIVQHGINDLKRKRETAIASVQDAKEDLRLAEEERRHHLQKVKDAEKNIRRARDKITSEQSVVDRVDKKLAALMGKLKF